MYEISSTNLSEWMVKLFPDINLGCINFGFWKDIKEPIDVNKRILSQKKLYFELFKYIKIKKGKILEVGSGRGHGVFWLTDLGFDAIGIDPLISQVNISQQDYPALSDHFMKGDG